MELRAKLGATQTVLHVLFCICTSGCPSFVLRVSSYRAPRAVLVEGNSFDTGMVCAGERMPNIRVALCTPLFLLLSSIPVLSQTPCQPTGSGVCRYVSATGSDSNDGLSRATPRNTIAVTVNASNPGDEIIVLAGTYNCATQPGVTSCTGGENSGSKLVNITASGTAANPIVIICDAYLACKISGTNNTTATGFEMAGSYITVKNFEIEGFSDAGWDNWNGGTHVVASRNWIHHIGRYCTTTSIGRDGLFVRYSNVTITQNIISDIGRYDVGENGCAATIYNHDHGIYMDLGPTDVLVANNVFYRTERGWGVQIYNGTTYANISILNNTFVWSDARGGAAGGHIVVNANVSNLVIENNISYQPNRWFVNTYAGTVTGTIANNVIYGTSSVTSGSPSGFSLTSTGNIVNTDPKLVSAGSSVMDNPSVPDAHLTSGSPAIKAGLTLAAVPVDFAGTPRISGAYDMGSYAYTLTSTVAPPTNLQVVVN